MTLIPKTIKVVDPEAIPQR